VLLAVIPPLDFPTLIRSWKRAALTDEAPENPRTVWDGQSPVVEYGSDDDDEISLRRRSMGTRGRRKKGSPSARRRTARS
jgi:hypothetical protein